MASILWKANSQGAANPGKLSVVLPKGQSFAGVSILDSSGKMIERMIKSPWGGEIGTKFYTNKPGQAYPSGSFLKVDLGNNIERYYKLGDTSQPRMGIQWGGNGIPIEANDMASAIELTASGAPSGGSGGGGGGFSPGQAGSYAYYPAYLGGMFPGVTEVNYKRIRPKRMQTAPYEYTDPMQFAQDYSQFNRDQYRQNFDLAKQFSLEQLQTELQGLQGYAPAAAALQREQVSLDNIFNQAQREAQVAQALPGVKESLSAQAGRAEKYARGETPFDLNERALELGVRSQAADMASAGGFGATSSVARKASDLMSEEQAFQRKMTLAGYGENLLTQNIQNKAALFMAPTEYANAGSQIQVMPEVGAGRLASQNLASLNESTMISPTTALQASIQQRQFGTQLEQQTRQFNASTINQTRQFNNANRFAASQINAAAANQFALTKFQYDVGFAGSVAGAYQTNANTELQRQLADEYYDIYRNAQGDTQRANEIASYITGGAALLGAAGEVMSALGVGGTSNKTTGTTGTQTAGTSDLGLLATPEVSATMPEPQLQTPSLEYQTPQTSYATAPQTSAASSAPPVSAATIEPVSYTKSSAGTLATPAIVSSFEKDTGLSTSSGGNAPQIQKALVDGSNVVLAQGGISPTPTQVNTVSAGANVAGQRVYSNPQIKASTDTGAGTRVASALSQALDPMGVMNAEKTSALDTIGTLSSDAAFLARLTDAYQKGDEKGFVNTLLQQFKQPMIDQISNDPQNRAGLSAAFDAYQLFANWGNMSPAQKSLTVAAAGIKGYQFADGTNLAAVNIIDPITQGKDLIRPGLNVGQALNFLNAGVNIYSAIDNWDQLNTIGKIAYGSTSVSSMISSAKSLGLLGKGISGAQVAVNSADIAAAGGSLAPTYGPGAISIPSASQTPAGYTVVASDGARTIALPKGLETAAQPWNELSTIEQIGQGAQFTGGALAVALGAQQVYKGWGEGGSKGALQGALGGSAIAGGLYMMGSSGLASGTMLAAATTGPFAPFVLGGVVAASLLGTTVKTGKSTAQGSRDSVRSFLKSNGIADKSYNLTLADGSKANIGIDGHGGYHEARNKELLTDPKSNRKLQAFDVDYTNDLDYVSGTAGIALTRILTGGKKTASDQLGGQIGNAAISNIGYGQDMTRANYEKMASNMRAFYNQSGVASKADAYALANQAYAEGRIDDSDLVSMQQTFDWVFDEDGFDKAQPLMGGRHQGIKAAPSVEIPRNDIGLKNKSINIGAAPKIPVRPPKSGEIPQTLPAQIESPSESFGGFKNMSKGAISYFQKLGGPKKVGLMNISKEEARSRNRQIYGAYV